jgi:hypothetical protein
MPKSEKKEQKNGRLIYPIKIYTKPASRRTRKISIPAEFVQYNMK